MSSKIPGPDNLVRFSQRELDEVLVLHKRFVNGQKGGVRAALKFLNLSNLNFRGADLSQADFTGSMLVSADMHVVTWYHLNK